MIIPLERFVDLTANNKPSERASNFFEDISRQINSNTITVGQGSPEGVIDGMKPQQYMDENGSTGNILYIKTTDSGNTGWVLV